MTHVETHESPRPTLDLAAYAKQHGIRYFMISYTDLFGAQRAKLVPAAAIADMPGSPASRHGSI